MFFVLLTNYHAGIGVMRLERTTSGSQNQRTANCPTPRYILAISDEEVANLNCFLLKPKRAHCLFFIRKFKKKRVP